MKHCLIVAFNYPPTASAGVHRTLRFTRMLLESNWKSVVLTSLANEESVLDIGLLSQIPGEVIVSRQPLSRLEDVIKTKLFDFLKIGKNSNSSAERKEVIESKQKRTAIGHLAAKKPILMSFRQKLLELSFAIPDDRIGWKKAAVCEGLRLVREHQPCVIYATAPPFSTLLVGHEIALKTGLPLVLDFRDPWTRVPWGPRNKSWLANRWVAALERRCVKCAAAVILNTQELRDDFIKFYGIVQAKKFIALPNGFDPEVRSRIDRFQKPAEPQNENRPFRLLHPGSMYRNRDPRPIVDAIAQLKQQGVNVILEQVGYCDANFDLAAYAAARNVAELIHIKPAIAHHEMLRYMSEVDGFLLLQPGTGLQIPGKLFEMILYQKPILALCVPGAVANVIQRYNIGTIADADNAAQIANAIRKLFDHSIPSENWDNIIADFDGRNLTRQLAEVFDSVSSSARSLNNPHD